jgi:hypothetical protein
LGEEEAGAAYLEEELEKAEPDDDEEVDEDLPGPPREELDDEEI